MASLHESFQGASLELLLGGTGNRHQGKTGLERVNPQVLCNELEACYPALFGLAAYFRKGIEGSNHPAPSKESMIAGANWIVMALAEAARLQQIEQAHPELEGVFDIVTIEDGLQEPPAGEPTDA